MEAAVGREPNHNAFTILFITSFFAIAAALVIEFG